MRVLPWVLTILCGPLIAAFPAIAQTSNNTKDIAACLSAIDQLAQRYGLASTTP